MIPRIKCLLVALSILACITKANAAPINGIFWSVPAATANNVPTLGNTPGPGATQWGTFTASSLNFSGDGSGNYNLGGFLNSFGAASDIVYMNGATAATNLTNVLFEFTGTALFTNGQSFSVEHDDGINLYVNGALIYGSPGITPPAISNFTYTGPTGSESFDFIYANGPTFQADFITTLVNPVTLALPSVPEPSTIVLLLTGSSALLSLRRKILGSGQP